MALLNERDHERDQREVLKRESKDLEDELRRAPYEQEQDKPVGARGLATEPSMPADAEIDDLAESAPKADGLRRERLEVARSLDRKETALELGIQPVPGDAAVRRRSLSLTNLADARNVALTADPLAVMQTNASGAAYAFSLADAGAKEGGLKQLRLADPAAPASGPALYYEGKAVTNSTDTRAPTQPGLKSELARADAAKPVAGGRGAVADAYAVSRESTVALGGASISQRQAGEAAQAAGQPSAQFYRMQNLPAQPARAVPAAAPPVTAVLNNFQWQQAGNAIRIVDGDNSVYSGVLFDEESAAGLAGKPVTGRVETEALEKRKAQTPALQAVIQTEQQAQARFRVSGTNRTLNQAVVFEGNFLATPDGPVSQKTLADEVANTPPPAAAPRPVVPPPQEPASRTSNESLSRQSQSQVQNQNQNQLNFQNQRGRIQGTLRIGNQAPVPVEALPVEPPR
jgi:hypothetical protein